MSVKLEEETREPTKKQLPQVKLLKYTFIQELNSTFAVMWTHNKVNTDLSDDDTIIAIRALEFH
jgi:hypothetical protein